MIDWRHTDVRNWRKAEVQLASRDFRFRGTSGHHNLECGLPQMTQLRNGRLFGLVTPYARFGAHFIASVLSSDPAM